MTTPRKHTKAIKYVIDDNMSVDDLENASQEMVDRYLESKGTNISALNLKIDRFAEALRGKLKLQAAAKQRASKACATSTERDLSSVSTEELLARLIEKYGRKEDIPFAARTTKAFKRAELESLYRDCVDE